MTRELAKVLDRIRDSQDPEALLQELSRCLDTTLSNVITMAAIVKRLEELNYEITVHLPSLPFLRRIAYGQLAAELFASLQGEPLLLEKAAALPLPDQEKVARNVPLKVMEADGKHRMVPPRELTAAEINQLFANGRIRTDAQQVGWLRTRLQRAAAKGAPTPDDLVHVDKRRGGIQVGTRFIPRKELARYLAELE